MQAESTTFSENPQGPQWPKSGLSLQASSPCSFPDTPPVHSLIRPLLIPSSNFHQKYE